MIYNLSQGLGIPIGEALYEWSYENLLLFGRSTPSYSSLRKKKEGGGKKWDGSMDANDPGNFKINPNSGNPDEEYIV